MAKSFTDKVRPPKKPVMPPPPPPLFVHTPEAGSPETTANPFTKLTGGDGSSSDMMKQALDRLAAAKKNNEDTDK